MDNLCLYGLDGFISCLGLEKCFVNALMSVIGLRLTSRDLIPLNKLMMPLQKSSHDFRSTEDG